VAFDFWDQVALAEELEEIRMYRPSAYQALPKSAPPDTHEGREGDEGHEGRRP